MQYKINYNVIRSNRTEKCFSMILDNNLNILKIGDSELQHGVGVWQPVNIMRLFNNETIVPRHGPYKWKIIDHNVPNNVIKKFKSKIIIGDI